MNYHQRRHREAMRNPVYAREYRRVLAHLNRRHRRRLRIWLEPIRWPFPPKPAPTRVFNWRREGS